MDKIASVRSHLFAVPEGMPWHHPSCGVCGDPRHAPIHEDAGWRKEAKQLRKNYEEECAQMVDFVALFEAALPEVAKGRKIPSLPLACLALHHLAMRFHTGAGPKALNIMYSAGVENLPPSFGNFGKLKQTS